MFICVKKIVQSCGYVWLLDLAFQSNRSNCLMSIPQQAIRELETLNVTHVHLCTMPLHMYNLDSILSIHHLATIYVVSLSHLCIKSSHSCIGNFNIYTSVHLCTIYMHAINFSSVQSILHWEGVFVCYDICMNNSFTVFTWNFKLYTHMLLFIMNMQIYNFNSIINISYLVAIFHKKVCFALFLSLIHPFGCSWPLWLVLLILVYYAFFWLLITNLVCFTLFWVCSALFVCFYDQFTFLVCNTLFNFFHWFGHRPKLSMQLWFSIIINVLVCVQISWSHSWCHWLNMWHIYWHIMHICTSYI